MKNIINKPVKRIWKTSYVTVSVRICKTSYVTVSDSYFFAFMVNSTVVMKPPIYYSHMHNKPLVSSLRSRFASIPLVSSPLVSSRVSSMPRNGDIMFHASYRSLMPKNSTSSILLLSSTNLVFRSCYSSNAGSRKIHPEKQPSSLNSGIFKEVTETTFFNEKVEALFIILNSPFSFFIVILFAFISSFYLMLGILNYCISNAVRNYNKMMGLPISYSYKSLHTVVQGQYIEGWYLPRKAPDMSDWLLFIYTNSYTFAYIYILIILIMIFLFVYYYRTKVLTKTFEKKDRLNEFLWNKNLFILISIFIILFLCFYGFVAFLNVFNVIDCFYHNSMITSSPQDKIFSMSFENGPSGIELKVISRTIKFVLNK